MDEDKSDDPQKHEHDERERIPDRAKPPAPEPDTFPERNVGLLFSVQNPDDFREDEHDTHVGLCMELDPDGRLFEFRMTRMSDDLATIQFRQGIAPQTAYNILRQTARLIKKHGTMLLNVEEYYKGGGWLDADGKLIWRDDWNDWNFNFHDDED